jgi:hypothetical protein
MKRFMASSRIAILVAIVAANCTPATERYPTQTSLFVHDMLIAPTGTATLLAPVDAEFGPDGDIIIVDQLAPNVVRFDSAATLIETLGEAGLGPGEFQRPTGVAVDPHSGAIAVLDEAANRVTVWYPDSTAPITISRNVMGTTGFGWSAEGELFVTSVQPESGGMTVSLEAFQPRSGSMREVHTERASVRSLLGLGGGASRLCVACPAAVSSTGWFAYAPKSASTYEIALLNSAGVTRQITGAAARVSYSPDEIRLLEAERDAYPPQLRAAMPIPTHMPAIKSIVFDHRGDLWVQVGTRERTRIDVYSLDGLWRDQIDLPDRIHLLAVAEDRILGLAFNDTTGVFEVRRYARDSTMAAGS